MKRSFFPIFLLILSCQQNQNLPQKETATQSKPKNLRSFVVGKEIPESALTPETPNPATLPTAFGPAVPGQSSIQEFGENPVPCEAGLAKEKGKIGLVALPAFTEDGIKKVFVKTTFTNVDLVPEDLNCHLCGPVFGAVLYAYTNEKWNIVAQNKCLGGADYGNWGAAPEAWLLPLGPDKHGLAYEMHWTGQGIELQSLQIAAPFENDKSIRFVFGDKDEPAKSETNPGAAQNPNDTSFYAYTARLDLIPADPSAYFDIVVTTSGTKPTEKFDGIMPVNLRTRFHFDGKRYNPVKD